MSANNCNYSPLKHKFNLAADDEISLHKASDCSDTALASAMATQASESLTVLDLGEDGTYTVYLKRPLRVKKVYFFFNLLDKSIFFDENINKI